MTIEEIAANTNHIITKNDMITFTPTFDYYVEYDRRVIITKYYGTGQSLNFLLNTIKQQGYSVFY